MDADTSERVKLAMEEHKTLNAELLQRNTVLVQVSTACITAIVALVGFMSTTSLSIWAGIPLVVFVLVVLWGVWTAIDSDARNAAKRIIEIEEFVNKSSGGDDRMPLSWQRRFGILSRGYADRFKRFDYDLR